jgi:hypothetical protein
VAQYNYPSLATLVLQDCKRLLQIVLEFDLQKQGSLQAFQNGWYIALYFPAED